MEKLERIASHPGTVKGTKKGAVTVEIVSTSACASCSAHAHCGFAESKTKTMDIPSADWRLYHEGERVTVHIDEGRGLLAVWIAYVLPALALLGVVVGLSVAKVAEWAVALAALSALGAYVAVLYAMRGRLRRTFTLTVEKC